MPVTTTKTDGYINRTPGGVKGRHMTKANAEEQARLLRAVDHGWHPSGVNKRIKRKRTT